MIAAQERRVLQSLLIARERAAGAGGIKRRDSGDGIGEEYEPLAVARPAHRRGPRAHRVVRANGRGQYPAPAGGMVTYC